MSEVTTCQRDLAATVLGFAEATREWPDIALESEVWGWDAYEEVRYAHLHTVMTLRALAARIEVQRANTGPLKTLAQHALADKHAVFRTLQALIAPLPADLFEKPPAPMEYPLRMILHHIVETDWYFLAAIENALAGEGGSEPDFDEVSARFSSLAAALRNGSPSELWGAVAQTHGTILEQLVALTDTQVEKLSRMWEPKAYPILFRMWRFGAHLREHTIHVEKTLAALGVQQHEADLHARDIYQALAAVEGARLGAGEVGREVCVRTAEELAARYETLFPAYAEIGRFRAAVEANDVETVRRLLAARPALARTRMDAQLSALLYALYRRRQGIVEALLEAGIRMGPYEAAAMDNVERLEQLLGWFPHLLNACGRDGYTLLQLACYFARPAAARLLLEMGADPNVVSQNEAGLTALHAAAAGRDPSIVSLLLAAGAEVNVRQTAGFTPLMAAQQNGDSEIEATLRGAGAVE
jgi:hypothetical protein